jgi:hypothetical protein
MDSLWLSLYWGSPIGLGVFFAGLGAFIYLTSKAGKMGKKSWKDWKEKE